MVDAEYVAGRVQMARTANTERDRNHARIKAIRRGDYESVAPGLFSSEFPKPLIANLIDTTARDIAEVMAPLPAFNCQSASLSNEADQKRQDLRGAIANGYAQHSRLQEQEFGGADRYNSFGFKAYVVEPDFRAQMPAIRVSKNHTAYYANDFRGRTKQYFEVYKAAPFQLCADFGDMVDGLEMMLQRQYSQEKWHEACCEIVRWYDDSVEAIVLIDPKVVLKQFRNPVGECMAQVVERPTLADEGPTGQFDDVIWVQVARGVIQQYTMQAIQRSVDAPIHLPDDVQTLDLGPYVAIQSKNPQGIGVVQMPISQGLFPEQSVLAQEQREGSRYPEGRSGSFDASIITGQGVQALMGTFDTQIQTYQRLNASSLRDVFRLCYKLDEALWPNTKKTIYIEDNGAPRKVEYTPSKDIAGNHLVNVSYGAIAGLDPNRGLVFVLQALAGGLISKSTARRSLPVDMNPLAEERQIDLEQMDASIAAALATLPQAIIPMATSGADVTDFVMKVVAARKLAEKGKTSAEALEEVFVPKQQEQPAAPDPLAALAQGGGGMPTPGAGSPSDMLMTLSGLTSSGQPNMQSNVSRMTPI